MGHGLGYSTWEYSHATLETDAESVSVTVTNTGSRQSREVVQLYFRPSAADRPVRLVGWSKVTVAPGHSERVVVHMDPRMWRRWDSATARWKRQRAGGQLLIARGLGDIRATLEVSSEVQSG